MDIKDKIEQRRKEREITATQEHRKVEKASDDKLQEKWEVLRVFNNASSEQKQQLIGDSLAIINSGDDSKISVNPNISREHAEFFIEAAANQETQSWFRALITGGLVLSIYIGFSKSWLLAIVAACVLIMVFGSLAMVVGKITKTNMIERHRLKLAADSHLQTERFISNEAEN